MPIPDFQSLMLSIMSVAEIFDDNFSTLQAARFCPFCSPYSKDKMI